MSTTKPLIFCLLTAVVAAGLCFPVSNASAVGDPNGLNTAGNRTGFNPAPEDGITGITFGGGGAGFGAGSGAGVVAGVDDGAPVQPETSRTHWDEFGAAPSASNWSILTIMNTAVSFPAIVLDAHYRPQIAFKDTTTLEMKYTRYDGAAWQTEVIDTHGDTGNFAVIALDSSQSPHMAWDNYVSHDIRYGTLNGFTRKTRDVVAYYAWARYISIYVDGKDYPHISYSSDSSDTIRYHWQDERGWHEEVVDRIFRDMWTDMAADAQDRPHVVYQTAPAAPYALNYAWRDGTWQIETVSTRGYGPVAIAIDAAGSPHIIREDMVSGMLEHFWKVDGTWQMEQVTPASYGPISFSFDQRGRPHLTFNLLDGAVPQVMYATNPGSGWQMDLIAQGYSYSGALTLDANDTPWIVFAAVDGRTLQLGRPASLEFPTTGTCTLEGPPE